MNDPRVGRDFDYRTNSNRGVFLHPLPPRPMRRVATHSVRPFVDVRARETIKVLEVSILPRR